MTTPSERYDAKQALLLTRYNGIGWMLDAMRDGKDDWNQSATHGVGVR